MIPILIQSGAPFVWNTTDWIKIREEYRIVGNLTGCLVGLPRQETIQGLPLMLLQEEVTFLIEKKLGCVISYPRLHEPPDQTLKEKYQLYKDTNKREQLECYEEQRKHQVTLMIDRIIEGKRRKLLGLATKKRNVKTNNDESSKCEDTLSSEIELDREEILKNELNKAANNSLPPLLVQTFTREQWLNENEIERLEWNFPETTHEKLRYSTFKDLWEKGFYITEGQKFGVDYLVYPGDPVKFHAQFLVICVDYNEHFSSVDLISYARLGSISRKTFVVATQLPNSSDILYQSIQWGDKI